MAFDPGPPQMFADIFERMPDFSMVREDLWFDWGPVFYRGRLDGTARLLCIASDPGPTERIAGRTLVGNAGQRVQGFLGKLGLDRSYLCLNAFPYALLPSRAWRAPALLDIAAHRGWRNELFDAAAGGPTPVRAIVVFGRVAAQAVERWPGASGFRILEVPHPSSRDPDELLSRWKAAVAELSAVIEPDPGVLPTPTYGATFQESDYAAIPRGDLPFGAPAFLGDDAWVRAGGGGQQNSVRRPPDDRHTLIWTAPGGPG